MDRLEFLTPEGVMGYVFEWDPLVESAKYDAPGWMMAYGDRIGRGQAPLPDGSGWIALEKYAVVVIA